MRTLSSVLTIAQRLVTKIDAFLTRERTLLYPCAFALGAALGLLIALIIPAVLASDVSRTAPDFLAPWTGAHFVIEGRISELYDPNDQAQFQESATGTKNLSWFVGPPPVALLYTPLALLPYGAAALVWTGLSITCLMMALRLLTPMAPRLLGSYRWHTTVVVLASYPVFELLGAGQQSAVTFLLWAAGIHFALVSRDLSAGVAFSLGLIKPQLFLFAPVVLVLQGRWKAIVSGGLVGLAALLVTITTLGPGTFADWTTALSSDAYQSFVQVGQTWKMVGFAAFIVSLAPPILADAAGLLGSVAAIAAAAVALVQLRRWIRAGVPAPYIWSLAVVATLAVSPHVLAYDAILLAIPLLVLAERHAIPETKALVAAVFVAFWMIPLWHFLANASSVLSFLDIAWGAPCVLAVWYVLTQAVQPQLRKTKATVQ